MGTVYDKLVDQAEAMVNIINKNILQAIEWRIWRCFQVLAAAVLKAIPVPVIIIRQSWMRFIIATQEIIHQGLIWAIEMVCTL